MRIPDGGHVAGRFPATLGNNPEGVRPGGNPFGLRHFLHSGWKGLHLPACGSPARLFHRKLRTKRLRARFGGAEYARAVKNGGNRRYGEARLDKRTQPAVGLHIRPPAASDRARFIESRRGVQARFVDGPAGAVTEADQLLGDAMATRGQADTEELRQAMVHYRTLFEELAGEPAAPQAQIAS